MVANDIVNTRIKEYRENKKLSYKDMSKITGFDANYIMDICMGKAKLNIDELVIFSEKLGIDIQYLTGESDLAEKISDEDKKRAIIANPNLTDDEKMRLLTELNHGNITNW